MTGRETIEKIIYRRGHEHSLGYRLQFVSVQIKDRSQLDLRLAFPGVLNAKFVLMRNREKIFPLDE
jgi:hypothetical protein